MSSSSTLGSFFCFVTRTNIWLDRVLSTSLRSKVGLNIRDRRSVIPTSWDRNDFPRTWQTGMRRQKNPAFCFTRNYVIVEFCLQFSIREIGSSCRFISPTVISSTTIGTVDVQASKEDKSTSPTRALFNVTSKLGDTRCCCCN